MSEAIEPFEVSVPESDLVDLEDRLRRTRWPDREAVQDWSQGVPLERVRALTNYWLNDYDWRRCEQRLNSLGQFKTTIDGLGIHFLHIRSPEPDALPLIMTHGWPGSVIEFMQVIGPLTDPAAHGGDRADAFHLVLPSLPGYGFSDRPADVGWNVEKIAAAWSELMRRLGFKRWVAQGGDWGSVVTRTIGMARSPGCVAIHMNMVFVPPTSEELQSLTPQEQRLLHRAQLYQDQDSGYAKQQSTRPQTLGYGLSDSPVGLAAWIYEKLQMWTDNDGAVESVLDVDAMLDNITLYWLTNTASSSARLYWESLGTAAVYSDRIDLPAGFSLFPKDILGASRRWVERMYTNLTYWNELDRGGHFAAWELPEVFTRELRNCFRRVR